MGEHLLCRLDELADPGSKGFTVSTEEAETLSGFVVRKGDQVYAYLNSCPHTGAPLEWQPDQFLDIGDSFIQCSLHGALFTIEEGPVQ